MIKLLSGVYSFTTVILVTVVVHSRFLQAEKNNLNEKVRKGNAADEHFNTDGLDLSTRKVKILLNTSDFKELRLYSEVFVDKSEMINEYLERGGIVLTITRPLKWGKSVNIDMFRKFFEIEVDDSGAPVREDKRVNHILFAGGNIETYCGTVKTLAPLKVSNYASAMDHQGNNPVILLSLKDITGRTFNEYEISMRNEIVLLYSKFSYLAKHSGNKTHPFNLKEGEKWEEKIFDTIKLKNSIHFLSKLLFKHFKRNVYIFIDNYDEPIANAYLTFGAKSEDFKKVMELTYNIIGKALKDNWFLERAILVGTFHFGWVNEILKLNDVRHSTIVDMTFSKFFGFTVDEVKAILSKLPFHVDVTKLQKWYNGYDFDEIAIFNPWSVLAYLSSGGQFDYYWGKMLSSNSVIDEVYLLDDAQEYVQQLLQNKLIIRKEINKPINLVNLEDTFHRVLLFGGFFKSVPGFCESTCYIHPWNLSIPNQEIRGILAEGVSKWVANKLNITIEKFQNLKNLLINIQIDSFLDLLKKYLSKTEIPKTAVEQQLFHHKLVGGLISSLAKNYNIESNRKAGQKCREYMLTSLSDMGNNIIVVEYEVGKAQKKMASAVEMGMKKLIQKEHISKVNHIKHYKTLTQIYMVLCKRKVALKYQISEFG